MDLISKPSLSRRDKLLLCIAFDVERPKHNKEIKEIANSAGLRESQKWNISSILGRSREFVVKTNSGWELTSQGLALVSSFAAKEIPSIAQQQAETLREQLSRITNRNTAKFVEEAIKCVEVKAYRAAVILSWVGAISILYDYVLENYLAAFNAEAKRQNPRWKDATTEDDLTRMREQDFLIILQSISVIGKSTKQELENCLRLRNGCGHPNSLEISENRAAAHMESLILNVFSRPLGPGAGDREEAGDCAGAVPEH